MESVFIGVDVGTGSARAGVYDAAGRELATAKQPIRMWQEPGDIVEQSSEDIWAACVRCVRQAMASAGVPAAQVRGLGFDATCSLVLLDEAARPVTVSNSGDDARNIIVWMDHRAMDQTRRINATGHRVLDYVGGTISPEMETPKLLWLKECLPQSFSRAAHFFDLADFLTFRATGSQARSVCTVTCKWTYMAHERVSGGGWDDDYFRTIGLEELTADDHRRIGSEVVEPGTPLGRGLTAEAAAELGLDPGTPVGASLIDAHAGGVGTLGATGEDVAVPDVTRRIAYIMGTSACIMASAPDIRFVPGVWGPYFSAMIPGLWLTEGGQSASGAALDHLLRLHPASAALAREAGAGLIPTLEQRVTARAKSLSDVALLASATHVLPEFLGNRSPNADPDSRAVLAGLDLDESEVSLQILFVAGLCGLAYGLADVVDALEAQGIGIDTIVISGGAARSALTRQILADVTGRPVALPTAGEPVLLGAAMLGAVASGLQPSLSAAMAAMSRLGAVTQPTPPHIERFHLAKRQVYALMQTLDRDARRLMAEAGEPIVA